MSALSTRWREDRSVRRKPKEAKKHTLFRRTISALIPQEKLTSLCAAFDHYTEHRTEAFRLLTQIVLLDSPCPANRSTRTLRFEILSLPEVVGIVSAAPQACR